MEKLIELMTSRIEEIEQSLSRYENESSSIESKVAKFCISAYRTTVLDLKSINFLKLDETFFGRTLYGKFSEIIVSPGLLVPGGLPGQVYWLAIILYMLVLEIGLRTNTFTGNSAYVISFFSEDIHDFPADYQARFELMRSQLLVGLNKEQGDQTKAAIDAAGTKYVTELSESVATIKGWEEKLNGWNTRAEKLEASIKESAGKLSFIGLSSAFSRLKDAKEVELKSQTLLLKFYGFALGVMPSIPIAWALCHSFQPVVFSWGSVPYITGSIVIELLLLYFFRISLHNYYSIKAQLLQIDLRYNICAFIEGYADFIKERKGDGENKYMEKFEALIFSGISADPQNIPSQFDGIDQLVKLAKEIKKS